MTSYPAGTPSWVDLGTSDIAAARDFYTAVLGWSYDETPPEAGGYVIATLRGRMVAGLMSGQPGTPSSWTTYFATDDSDGVAKRISAAGGTVMMGPMQVLEQGRMTLGRDPTGGVFGLWEPGQHRGAELANESGAICWNELVTRDLPAARRFYEEALGITTEEMPMPDGDPYVMVKVGDRPVAGMLSMPKDAPAELPTNWLTYFAVADTDAAAAAAKRAGGQVLREPADAPYGRFAVVSDPQGATFAILQLPPG